MPPVIKLLGLSVSDRISRSCICASLRSLSDAKRAAIDRREPFRGLGGPPFVSAVPTACDAMRRNQFDERGKIGRFD